MATSQGKFVWYDLMTTDMAAAEAMYSDVVGWEAKDAGMPTSRYTIFSVAGRPVAGLMTIPDEVRAKGGRPAWMGYIGVDDVDRAAEEITQKGGAVHQPATDIPGVGRFAAPRHFGPQGHAGHRHAPVGKLAELASGLVYIGLDREPAAPREVEEE